MEVVHARLELCSDCLVAVVHQDRRGPRQHIVRVGGGPFPPAFSQVREEPMVRQRPSMCTGVRPGCRPRCRQGPCLLRGLSIRSTGARPAGTGGSLLGRAASPDQGSPGAAKRFTVRATSIGIRTASRPGARPAGAEPAARAPEARSRTRSAVFSRDGTVLMRVPSKLHIFDQGGHRLRTVPRTTRKEVTRFKAYGTKNRTTG